MSRGALDRDVSTLRVHDGAADREPQAEPARLLADGTGSEEALEEAVLLVEGYARPLIRDRNPHVTVNALRADRYASPLGGVLAGVRDEVGEDLRRPALIGNDAVGVGVERLDELLSLRLEHGLDERHRLGQRVLEARGLSPHLERARLDAAGVHEVSTRCSNRRALRRSAPASKASSLRGMLSASSTTRSSEAMSPEIGVRSSCATSMRNSSLSRRSSACAVTSRTV